MRAGRKIPTVNVPFDTISIDLIGSLTLRSTRGHKWILTIVDLATRYPEATPLKGISIAVIAETLIGLFASVGIPTIMHRDNDWQFNSAEMKEICKWLGMVFKYPYHPYQMIWLNE